MEKERRNDLKPGLKPKAISNNVSRGQAWVFNKCHSIRLHCSRSVILVSSQVFLITVNSSSHASGSYEYRLCDSLQDEIFFLNQHHVQSRSQRVSFHSVFDKQINTKHFKFDLTTKCEAIKLAKVLVKVRNWYRRLKEEDREIKLTSEMEEETAKKL